MKHLVKETVPLLSVADVAAAVQFYETGLGFDVVQRWEPNGVLAWCRVECGGAALMLQQASGNDLDVATGRMSLYFICDDVDAVYAALLDRGVEVSPPANEFYGMRQVFLTDPDGVQVCFEQPVDAV